MPADEYYDQLNDRLDSDAYCVGENEFDGELNEEDGGEPCEGNGERLLAESPSTIDRVSTAEEVHAAIEQERILEASRSVRAGTDLLMSAMRKAKVMP